MLMYGLIAGGHCDVSNGALDFIFKLLATPEFTASVASSGISRSLYEMQQRQTSLCAKRWQEVTRGPNTFYVRDLQEVLLELLGDKVLLRSLKLSSEIFPGQDLQWGRHWTAFPVYQRRQRQVKEQYGETCELISFGLWLDAGETDRLGSSSIYMIALAPLNAPVSLARRPDCIFPIAYVYNDTDVLEPLRHLLPKLKALRQPRFVSWLDGRLKRVCFSIDMLSGDHPAITKALGTVMTASSNFPCKVCMISNREGENLNDCSRWRQFFGELHLRTQVEAEQTIIQMQEGEARQAEVGMRQEFANKSHPIFEYFHDNSAAADAFVCTVSDVMHDLYLGLYKDCFRALASEVLHGENAAQNVRTFKAGTLELASAYLFGIDVTVFRKGDVRETSKTDLLHLLENGSLFAREYQALAPLLLILFDSVESRKVKRAVPYMAGLVSYGALLESREWPVNASDNWWNDLRDFAIGEYEHFQKEMLAWLPKQASLIKVHDILCHGLRAARLHGPFLKTQGFEGLFRYLQRFTTNHKDVGHQLFGKLQQFTEAANWISQGSGEARAVQQLIDPSSARIDERRAGDCTNELEARVVNFLRRHCEKHGWSLERCPKWILLPQETNEANLSRGASKLYAAPKFHKRAKFDVVEFGNPEQERYMMMQGLGIANDNGRFRTLLCGFDLVEVSSDSAAVFCRMPIVRLLPPEQVKLKIRELGDSFTPVMAVPHLRGLEDAGYREELSRVKGGDIVQFSRAERVMYINIFATHGEGRYTREWRWHPSKNGIY